MSKKVLTVFGATGNQGGSVIATILNHSSLSSQFTLRAITRNTSSDKAKALASKGVELATADLNDPATLTEAIKGSYAVFAVTNYWETMSSPAEVAQGKAIADASAANGVKHIVWSSLPHVTKLTNGTLKNVEHFDGKSDVETYIESIKGKSGMVATYFMPGFYMPNIKGMTRKNESGVPTLTLPWDAEKTQVPLFNPAADTGTFVAGILAASDPKSVDGAHIHAVGEWITPTALVNTITEVSGTKVDFNSVPEDVYIKFLPDNKAAKELTENMVLVRDYSYYGKGAEKEQKTSNEVLKNAEGLKPQTWKEFVQKNGPWQW